MVLIVLPFIFILFLIAIFLAFMNAEGLSTEQKLDYRIKALTSEAKLQRAFLWKAENLEQQQIESAKGDRTTILPENLQPPEHWKTKVSPLDTET